MEDTVLEVRVWKEMRFFLTRGQEEIAGGIVRGSHKVKFKMRVSPRLVL